jgi:predicted nucleic acid-binding protein
MSVLVDTSIWSAALRRGTVKNQDSVNNLTVLIQELRVRIIGPVRQEILSGIKTEKQFQELRLYLSAFPDLPLEAADYQQAAEFFNICRRNGILGSNTDFLICSAAHRRNLEIFTSDHDFLDFRKHLPIKIYKIRNELDDMKAAH